MPLTSPRGARHAAPLALVVAGLLAACSGGRSTGATPVSASSPTSSSSTDPRAAQVLATATSTLAAQRSFRFDATETVTAKRSAATHVFGAVVRGQGVAYTLSVGTTTTQVVRIKNATYVRKVPGRWAKLTKPRPVADPTGSLAAILTGLRDARLSTASPATVAGTLDAAAAKSAGIPTSAQPAQVTVTVDSSGRVSGVTVHTVTQAGTSTVTVTLVTSYTAFDRVPALRAPR